MSAGAGRSRIAISEINVTPFVDVMLVLLVIFMVTAPMMQQGINVDLPKTAPGGLQPNEEPFLIVVNKGGRVAFGQISVPIHEVRAKLSAIFQTRRNKQVYIQADQAVNYGAVAEVMGEVKSAGITNIGLVTVPK